MQILANDPNFKMKWKKDKNTNTYIKTATQTEEISETSKLKD